MNLPQTSLAVVALAALTVLPTAAEAQADVLKAEQEFVDTFNKGDTKSVLAACTDEMSIIDEFPPYEWHGAGYWRTAAVWVG